MNSVFTAKLLQNLRNKKANKGFTLIELLVVVIIIGVLAAVALPNLLGQVAKGRQAEAKNNLGAVNRAQQAYRLEKAVFGDLTPAQLGTVIQITGEYYTYAGNAGTAAGADTSDNRYAVHTATPIDSLVDDVLNYASGVGQKADGTFESLICEDTVASGADADDVTVTDAGGANTGDIACSNGVEI